MNVGSLLARHAPHVLLPAHGDPIADPLPALAETQRRLGEIMELRRAESEPWNLDRWLTEPWEALSPHLLRNRTSFATSYAVLSDSASALLVDWGYDLWTGMPSGGERATCRPLLESIGALRRDHGVEIMHRGRQSRVAEGQAGDGHVARRAAVEELRPVAAGRMAR